MRAHAESARSDETLDAPEPPVASVQLPLVAEASDAEEEGDVAAPVAAATMEQVVEEEEEQELEAENVEAAASEPSGSPPLVEALFGKAHLREPLQVGAAQCFC